MTLTSAFTPQQFIWLLAGMVMLFISIVLFIRGKISASLFVLTIGGFVLRLMMTSTDPFLYDWDEQYHALVAKNLAAHPGTPMLYDDPLLPVDISRWADNHIWLHKPPLFLWLIAVSVKLFGATPFAVKLPSVLLSSLMIPALFRFMKRLTSDRTAWFAALLLAAHSWSIQLVSGFRNTDHNDIIFSAFVLFSFGAWMKYADTQRRRDAIVTGILVGCAILVKWLPGMLVFIPWGLWLIRGKNRRSKRLWIDLAAAVSGVIAVALPWYIHIFRYFPAEAAYEMYYNRLHWSIAIEGHDGPWYYHLDAIREILGWGLAVLSIPGLILLATRNPRELRGLYITAAIIFFFVFYTLAETKMPLFMLPIIPFLLGGVAIMVEYGVNALSSKRIIGALVLCAFTVYVVDPYDIVVKHSALSELAWYRDEMASARTFSENFMAAKPSSADTGKRCAVFNFPENARAAFMFYTGEIAYKEIPSVDSLRMFSSRGYGVDIIDGENVPADYRTLDFVRIIPRGYFQRISASSTKSNW